MQKQKQITNKISYVVMAILLVTYILFPSWYRTVSQRLFSILYTQHAQSLQNDIPIASSNTVPKESELLPIFVMARPPQTPYDYLITTVPEHQQFTKYKKGTWYVYDETVKPIGYIEKVYPTLFIVTLFSAPKSNEVFSVNNYISRSKGEGGGGFSLQIPIDMAVTIGTPITHQATGKVVSTVIAINSIPEKNIQKVTGVLKRSPFEMATLYVAHKSNDTIVSKPVESAIDTAKSIATDEQHTQEEGKNSNAKEIVSE